MSVESQKLKRISQRVIELHQSERERPRGWRRRLTTVHRWALMVYHEFLRDEVILRAQSLSFLMIFSLLPLIAGAFFIFTFFAQFGMVQDALQSMVDSFLATVPSTHRAYINDYILRFKDAYLANVTEASGSVGVFAIFILGWVGLQTFNNVDATLNYIWSADRSRPFHQKLGNFIVVAVVAPIILTGGFSVPLILQKFAVTKYFLERFPLLAVLLNYVIPATLLFATFLLMYRFVPVRKVWWRSALYGALFATAAMGIVNAIMHLYFIYGTNTAYGKAAAVPLVGFWIYALWIVVILGAEISFLVQNGRDIFYSCTREPSLREGRGLFQILADLFRAYETGGGPLSFERLRDVSGMDSEKVRANLQFLCDNRIIAECVGDAQKSGGEYTLIRRIDDLSLSDLLEKYYSACFPESGTKMDEVWRSSFEQWTSYFRNARIADLAK